MGFLFFFFFFLNHGTSLAVQSLSSPSNAGGTGLIPVSELGSHMTQGQKTQIIKQKHYCNKLNKDFENGPHQKTLKKKIISNTPNTNKLNLF